MPYFGDVEIPAELIDAQQRGDLVIFVGAGASMGPPSNLPSFWRLTEIIRDQSELTGRIGKLDGQALDEVLAKIDQEHDVDVHLRAVKILSVDSSAPNELHYSIANLAKSTCTRVVTTNYDRHLSQALGQSTNEYVGPALPVGSNFQGLVYLHGSLPRTTNTSEPTSLVMTAKDFGTAYLTDAWAARFLERMFATYPTLFIGYSHDDAIMKFLARGLGPQAKKRYILTDKPESDDWTHLNIIPIAYSPSNGHRALYEAINKWAKQSQDGLLDRQRQIEAIVSSRSPQDLSPEEESYLESTIADEKSVKFFCDHAGGEEWLAWIAQRSAFRQLFVRGEPSTVISWRLATWFARTYVTPEMTHHSLAVAGNAGGHLGTDVWDAIARQLISYSRGQLLPESLFSWIVLLIRDAPEHEPFLEVLLSNSSLPGNSPAAVALFSYLTEPQLGAARYVFGGSRFEVRFRGGDHWLREAWNDVFKPCFPDVTADLLAVIDQQLRRAQRDISLANGPDMSSELLLVRGPIASIDEQTYHDSLDLLIDFARDCIESMLDIASAEAEPQLSAWASSDIPLLRRLAVHGWTYRTDVAATAKIEWLSALPWIVEYSYETEVVPLLSQAAGAAVDAVNKLIAQLITRADDDEYSARRAFRFLHVIREHTPFSADAERAIAILLERHEDLQRFVEPAPAPIQQLAPTLEELQDLVERDAPAAVRAIRAQAEQEPQIRWYTWDESASQLTGIVRQNPTLGFNLLNAVNGAEPLGAAVIGAVVGGWSQCTVGAAVAEQIVSRLLDVDLSGAVGAVTLMLMPTGRGEDPRTDWWSAAGSKELATKCWSLADTTPSDTQTDDWMHTAINHPAGQLTLYWIRVLEDEYGRSGQDWTSLPDGLATQFEYMLQSGDCRCEMAQVIFARMTEFLHRLDPVWCEEHVLPLFTWDEKARAIRSWSGFLSGGSVTDSLLEAGMMESVLTAVDYHGELHKRFSNSLIGLLSSIALKASIEPATWISRFVRAGDLEMRVTWADRIAENLASMEAAEVEAQWNRWMKAYWRDRLESVPRKLSFDESSAMAAWVVYLLESASEGVELALERPAGFTERTLIMHKLSEDRIQHAPSDFAHLVAHLLSNTKLPFYGYDLPELVGYFRGAGVPEYLLTEIEERSLHLGIALSELQAR